MTPSQIKVDSDPVISVVISNLFVSIILTTKHLRLNVHSEIFVLLYSGIRLQNSKTYYDTLYTYHRIQNSLWIFYHTRN